MAESEPPGMVTGNTAESDYQLGHDHAELERLNRQGRILAPATRIILEAAGLLPGMQVLDLGSGMGDVAFVAAELIGPTGQVVGIDRSPDSVAKANIRARQRGLSHVRFVVGDIHNLGPAGPFDAIIGRLVLMYVSDPAAVLRTQAALLGPGGLVIPIEFDVHTARSIPSTPLVDQAVAWIAETFTRSGIATSLGPRLWAVLGDAGLQPLGMIALQPHFGSDDPDGPAIVAGIIRTILPLIERTGVATAEQVGAETLEQRLTDEFRASAAVFAHPTLFGAWATVDRK